MTQEEFLKFRKKIGKTQKEIANLLGISLKTVYSYEQGWRNIPSHVQRQIFFLLSRVNRLASSAKACWLIKKCPPERKTKCPAWEFQAGTLCWFVNGTICECKSKKSWNEKISICRKCEVLTQLL